MASVLETSSHSSNTALPLNQGLRRRHSNLHLLSTSSFFLFSLSPKTRSSCLFSLTSYVTSFFCQMTAIFMSSPLNVKGLSSLNFGKNAKIQSTWPRFWYIQSESQVILSFLFFCFLFPAELKFQVYYLDAKSYFEFQKLNFNSFSFCPYNLFPFAPTHPVPTLTPGRGRVD